MHTRVDFYVQGVPRHQVRELVCSYRPARDGDGRIVSIASLAMGNPHEAVHALRPLIAGFLVRYFRFRLR